VRLLIVQSSEAIAQFNQRLTAQCQARIREIEIHDRHT
jgi:hypothetical protein